MQIVSITEIDTSVFTLDIISDDPERLSELSFTWNTTEFTSNHCLIQLTFDKPLKISSNLGPRD